MFIALPDRFTADFKFYFRESVEGSEIRPVYSPPVEIFADGVSILPRQTEFQEVYVAQAVDMGRSAIYFHFPERITPACTSFDALYFYIAGFYVIEEKILFPGFPRLDMIYVLPMLSIVGYLYFIFFAIGCFPVQTDTINIDRLLQVDIEPFVVTGPARPAGAFVAVCDIFRSLSKKRLPVCFGRYRLHAYKKEL